MTRAGQRRLALLLLLALGSPWAVAWGAVVHVLVEHGHDHEPSGVLTSLLPHGHEHAVGTPDHDHACLPSAQPPVKTAPAAWACASVSDRLMDVSVPSRWLTPQGHPPPSSARLLPGDLLRI